MLTIKELCQSSGLSRTTLLYYESIGLLTAEERSQANYRLYGDASLRRLQRICTYRDAGVPLKEIAQILNHDEDVERAVLEKTLALLNQKAREIKAHQSKLTSMLNGGAAAGMPQIGLDRETILSVLTFLDIGDDFLLRMHQLLEKNSSQGHLAFLQMCGFSEKEIDTILSKVKEKTREKEET